MNTENDKFPEDTQLSSLYAQAEQELPATHIDDAILAAAKRNASPPGVSNPFSNSWRIPASLAAVLMLSFGIINLMENDLTTIDGVIPTAIRPQAPLSTIEESSLSESKITLEKAARNSAEPRLNQLAAESPSAATASTSRTKNKQDLRTSKSPDKNRNKKIASKSKIELQKILIEDTEQLSFTAAMPARMAKPINRISTGIDEQTNLRYWHYQDDGLSIRFMQRLANQTRDYFIARSFTAKHAKLIAQRCVFQTVLKNISHNSKPSSIVYHMKNWVVSHQGKVATIKTREHWAKQWQQPNTAPAVRLAFESALLPTRQNFQAGDYNGGMVMFDLKPESSFSLKLTWQQYDKQHSITIPNMQCAADLETP